MMMTTTKKRSWMGCICLDSRLKLNEAAQPRSSRISQQISNYSPFNRKCEMDVNKTSINLKLFHSFHNKREDWRVGKEKKKKRREIMNFVLSMSIRSYAKWKRVLWTLSLLLCVILEWIERQRFTSKSQGESLKLSILKSVLSELN